MIPFPDKKYHVIYADPPWSYNNFASGKAKSSTTYGAAAHHYLTMSIEDICTLPVQDIAEKDCILFLWATYPNLEEAFKVIKAWGFTYKTCAFTWAKTRGKSWHSGLGFYTNGNAEICLLAKQGAFKRAATNVKQLIVAPVTKHSEKPIEARTRIEQLCGNISRIELFARKETKGWDVWGDEV